MRSATRVAAFAYPVLAAVLIAALVAGPAGARAAMPPRRTSPCRWRSSRTGARPTRGCATTRRAAATRFFMTRAKSCCRSRRTSTATAGVALALRFVGGNPRSRPRARARARRGQRPARQRSAGWQTRTPAVPRRRLPRPVARHRPAPARAAGVLKYEFHVHPGRVAVGHPAGVRRRRRPRVDDDRRAADRDPARHAARLGAGVVPGHRRRPGARDEPLRAGRRRGHGGRGSRSRSAATGATTNWSSTRACSTRPSSAATAPRPAPASPSTRPATPTSPARRSRPNFPTTAGAFDRTGAAQNFADVFVTKLNPAGTALVYSTFVGGSDMEFGNAAWPSTRPATPTSPARRSRRTSRPPAARSTGRLNIPPNCPRCGTDNTDGFVFKLNAAGSALAYSTYLGGTEYDAPRGIAVDGVRQRLRDRRDAVGRLPDHGRRVRRARGAASTTCSSPSSTHRLGARRTPRSSAARRSTTASSVTVDGGGNAYVLGFSSSTDFPTTPGAFDTTATAPSTGR